MYVGLHFGKPDVGAAFVPDYLPMPYFWNYFTAFCIIAFIVSAVIGKYDKLAYTLMALYVVLMAVLVHLPRAMGHELGVENMTTDLAQEQELEMVNLFRNIMVTGALIGFARFVARDKRVIG
ncbi:hypothetical protein L0657_21930 [Dyadobacter sp. CY345]|uniref:hypothetical protein n=1 Tax=Dyadobacter sp. CY345 TaxID=2909335 RepID=UPI001F468EB8|nr:hypothetical protein [Dyadobacter sp. CY345]MCF2446633.1 hypothetical protein [Dyadobacter sp. CY345]